MRGFKLNLWSDVVDSSSRSVITNGETRKKERKKEGKKCVVQVTVVRLTNSEGNNKCTSRFEAGSFLVMT